MNSKTSDRYNHWTLLHALRAGRVPDVGLEDIAVGIEEPCRLIDQDLERLVEGQSSYRVLLGEREVGKSFLSSAMASRALSRGLLFGRTLMTSVATGVNPFVHLCQDLASIDGRSTRRLKSLSHLSFALLAKIRQRDPRAGLVLAFDELEVSARFPPKLYKLVFRELAELAQASYEQKVEGLYLVFSGQDSGDWKTQVHHGAGCQKDQIGREICLKAFTKERLLEVARKVRSLYPSALPLENVVDDEVIRHLGEVLSRDIGQSFEDTPRVFLQAWVEMLDRADEHPNFEPFEFLRSGGLDSSRWGQSCA